MFADGTFSSLRISWIPVARLRGWSPNSNAVEVSVKYPGREIPDEFVVGFGLDYDERYRNLDSIAVLKPEVYQGEQA